jgi:protein-S-isoprenylcysteine O-methyltransferase Ste14
MEAATQPTRQPWRLGNLYKTTAAIIILLIVCAPSFYNSELLLPLALALLTALLILGAFAGGLLIKNLVHNSWQRSLAWLLLAGLNFAGWWVNYRISVEAMKLPLSPDDPALGALLYHTFAPYFSS